MKTYRIERALPSRGKTNRIVRRAVLRHSQKVRERNWRVWVRRSGIDGVHATKQRKICSTKCLPCIIFNQNQIFFSSSNVMVFPQLILFVAFGSRCSAIVISFAATIMGLVLFVCLLLYGDQNGLLMQYKHTECTDTVRFCNKISFSVPCRYTTWLKHTTTANVCVGVVFNIESVNA